jgi:hypothetical protein
LSLEELADVTLVSTDCLVELKNPRRLPPLGQDQGNPGSPGNADLVVAFRQVEDVDEFHIQESV